MLYPPVNVYITIESHHAMKMGKSTISMGHSFQFANCLRWIRGDRPETMEDVFPYGVYQFVVSSFNVPKTKSNKNIDSKLGSIYPLVNKHRPWESSTFNGFTSLPTPMTARVYVNLLEGNQCISPDVDEILGWERLGNLPNRGGWGGFSPSGNDCYRSRTGSYGPLKSLIYPLIAWWIFPVRYVNVYRRVYPMNIPLNHYKVPWNHYEIPWSSIVFCGFTRPGITIFMAGQRHPALMCVQNLLRYRYVNEGV